jgi:cell division protein FtsW
MWRRNQLRCSVISAMSFMIFFQTALHIAVNLNLVPATGLTLPLISYGGSSLVGTMLMLAIIISAGRQDCVTVAGTGKDK